MSPTTNNLQILEVRYKWCENMEKGNIEKQNREILFSKESLEEANNIEVGNRKFIKFEADDEKIREKAIIESYPQMYEIFGKDLLSAKEIEHSLQTTYRTRIMSKFTKALKTYKMIEDGDKLGIAISGGKDSLLMAKLFQALVQYTDIPFEVEFFAMDPGYAPINRDLLEFNLAWLDIPTTIIRSDIFAVSDMEDVKSPCYMCARMRRGFLYSAAKSFGCNKLCLGHHFNDAIETILLNILWAANYKAMMPKIVARNFDNMELLRPLYMVEEDSIIAWRDYVGLKALDCACTVTQSKEGSQRKKVKELIKELKKDNPRVEKSIFRSAQNVAVDAILGYINHGDHHSFLENYGDKEWEL